VFTWYTGLKYVKVSEAAIILMLGSPITTCLNALASGAMSTREFFGIIIAIAGVIIAVGANKSIKTLQKSADF
jgi:drug/metabolite transporter (DMT)-like permease